MDVTELVGAINLAEGTAYRYRGTLPGGHQSGAHLIADGPRDFVLKLGQGGWLRQIEEGGSTSRRCQTPWIPNTKFP